MESLTRITTALVAGTLGGAMLIGCADQESALPTCVPVESTWGAVPAEMDYASIATTLGEGLTAAQVQAGGMGKVHCEQGVTFKDMDDNTPRRKVAVQDRGSRCLVVGIVTGKGEKPQAEKSYQDLYALCPKK